MNESINNKDQGLKTNKTQEAPATKKGNEWSSSSSNSNKSDASKQNWNSSSGRSDKDFGKGGSSKAPADVSSDDDV